MVDAEHIFIVSDVKQDLHRLITTKVNKAVFQRLDDPWHPPSRRSSRPRLFIENQAIVRFGSF